MKSYARTVIFDGDCGFCRRQVKRSRALDWFGRIDWRMRLEPGIQERFPQASREETQRQMVLIRADGKTYGGFYAVRDIMLQLPLTFLPALLMYIPGVSLIGVPAYKWIAENRHRLGRKSESCELPLNPDHK